MKSSGSDEFGKIPGIFMLWCCAWRIDYCCWNWTTRRRCTHIILVNLVKKNVDPLSSRFILLGILDNLQLLCAHMDQLTLMISRLYRMHLQKTKWIKIFFYLDLPMDLWVHRMPMKTMKMRQLFTLVTGDAAFHRRVGYMDNRDRCLPRFGLPAIWRLSASGLVRSVFPLSHPTFFK